MIRGILLRKMEKNVRGPIFVFVSQVTPLHAIPQSLALPIVTPYSKILKPPQLNRDRI